MNDQLLVVLKDEGAVRRVPTSSTPLISQQSMMMIGLPIRHNLAANDPVWMRLLMCRRAYSYGCTIRRHGRMPVTAAPLLPYCLSPPDGELIGIS